MKSKRKKYAAPHINQPHNLKFYGEKRFPVYNFNKKKYIKPAAKLGMVEKTGTGYRTDGYRIDGYRIDGYRIDGYRIDGYRIDGYHYTRNLELIRKTAIFSRLGA